MIDKQTKSFDKKQRSGGDILAGGMTLQEHTHSGESLRFQIPGVSKLGDYAGAMLATIGGSKYSHTISPPITENKYQSKYHKTFMRLREKPLPDSIMIRRKALVGQASTKQEKAYQQVHKE